MSGTSSCRCSGDRRPARCGVAWVAHDVVELDPALLHEPVELLDEDDVLGGDDPVERNDVATHLLEQRTHRRDADSAADQNDLVAPPSGGGEDAEGAFGKDARAGLDLTDAAREVAQVL